jgi:hypothetical protein
MTTKKYQVEKKGFGMLIIVAIFILLLLFYDPSLGFIIAIGIVAAIAATIHLRWEYTYSVEINTDDNLITVVSKSRTNTVTDKIALDEAYFTYKKRFDYYGGIENHGIRKKPRSILQIECKRKTMAILVPGQDGWSDGMILSLARDLSAAGVKQVVEKDNKAEIPITTSSP